MALLHIDTEKCSLCLACVDLCPFGALTEKDGAISINESCRLCKACIKKCPENAIALAESGGHILTQAEKNEYKGVMVFAEVRGDDIHPVTAELIGEALRLTNDKPDHPVYALLIGGQDAANLARKLPDLGVDKVYVYQNEALHFFRADLYTNMAEECIKQIKPSVVLMGATPFGRSFAPRVATRFKSGLTADCTELQMRESSDLVQIRPAFGGNIMAQIISPDRRPQFATVRYKVMEPAAIVEKAHGTIEICEISPEQLKSDVTVINYEKSEKGESIEEASVLVVAGRGVKNQIDLAEIEDLARLLGGQLAVTRPLVEAGWTDYRHQIGLSGRTVKPDLIITFGVSGSVQFAAGMKGAECIIAINTDRSAPIFNIAHYCVVADLYDVLPGIRSMISKGGKVNV